MQAFFIVICSVLISSLLWLVLMLLLGKHKLIEEVQDSEVDETIEYNYIGQSDKNVFYEEIDADCDCSYDIADEMIAVAVAGKIAGRIVSKDFSFSIN